MKMIAFMLGLSFNPIDYTDYIKIDLNIQEPVKSVYMYAYNDQDVLVELNDFKVSNETISLFVKENKDYQLVINDDHYITVSPHATEIIDDRDIDISCNGSYEMIKGVLVFNLSNLTVK